jgi:hypothetical protein
LRCHFLRLLGLHVLDDLSANVKLTSRIVRPERPRRPPKSPAQQNTTVKQTSAWDARRFVESFVRPTPATILAVTQAAIDAGLSERKSTKLLKQAESQGLIHGPLEIRCYPSSATGHNAANGDRRMRSLCFARAPP